MMNDMPARIWAQISMDGRVWDEPTDSFELYTEYVRADKYAELEAELEGHKRRIGTLVDLNDRAEAKNKRLVELLKTSVAEFDDGIKYPLEVVNDLKSVLASMEKDDE